MGASGVMAASSGIQAASAVGTSYAQAQALKTKADYDKSMADLNAKMANFQADDAIKRGDKAVGNKALELNQLKGAQRAALAANGVDVSSGSAADIQADTAATGAREMMTIQNNAWREAWGYKAAAANMGYQGQFAQMSGRNMANNTLLTGGLQGLGYGVQAYTYGAGAFPGNPGTTDTTGGTGFTYNSRNYGRLGG